MVLYINGKTHTVYPYEILPNVYVWDYPPKMSDLELKLHLEIVNNRVEIVQRPSKEVSIGMEITPNRLIISVDAKTQERTTTYIETIELLVVGL